MQALSDDETVTLLQGHVDVRYRPGSIQPLRFPVPETDYYDPFNRWVASCPAGVRIRVQTDARDLRLKVRQRLSPPAQDAERRGAFDLFVDGHLVERAWGEGGALMDPQTGLLTGNEANTVHFSGLPAGDKVIEIWLPQAATISIVELALTDHASWRPAPDDRPRILFHGSSITHCMEADGASAGWPAIAAELAGFSHQNLGWAGSCLLSALAARVIRDAKADAIILKLGINVWPEGALKTRTFLDSVHGMLSIIREKHRTTPIVVVSPIYSPGRENGGEGLSLEAMRTLLQQAVQARIRSEDTHIRYLSGLDLFGSADAHLLPDNLHPNTAGYRLMGERFHAAMLSGPDRLIQD